MTEQPPPSPATDPSGDFSITLAEDRSYIRIKVYRPMTSDIGRRSGVLAARLGAEEQIERYLLDLRGAPNRQSVMTNYQFANTDLEGFGFSRSARTAALVDPDDHSHDFIVIAMLKAGFEVRLFHEEDAARAWLRMRPALLA